MPTTLVYPEAPPERGRGARVDGELKVCGQMLYADDLALPGLLYVVIVIPNVPTAAAIANAVADAVGVRMDTLPITAEKVMQALSMAYRVRAVSTTREGGAARGDV